jgi:NhaP-type Na+/H+ or K+/H+ antiporter
VGWFGPRGLASVVFGLLALEALGEQAARPAVAVIAFTVLLSVVAHGLTAEPLAKRYGARLSPAEHSAGAGGAGTGPWTQAGPALARRRGTRCGRAQETGGAGDHRPDPVRVGLILVLAVGSQVLASRPAHPGADHPAPGRLHRGRAHHDVNPQRLLGAAFQPLVSLAVAVILYDAGLALDLGKLRGTPAGWCAA